MVASHHWFVLVASLLPRGLTAASLWEETLPKDSWEKIRSMDHGISLVTWIKETAGGSVNSKLELRQEEPFSRYGWFASEEIAEGEVLMTIPRSIIVRPDPLQVGDRVGVIDENNGDLFVATIETVEGETASVVFDDGKTEKHKLDGLDHYRYCGITKKLIQEFKLGDQSHYAPYIHYLQSLPTGQLPDAWSQRGKDMLKEITGDLPPAWLLYHIDDWHKGCKGTTDAVDEHALLTVIQREFDEFLIPGYDMLNHRNGIWPNVHSTRVREGDVVEVRSSRIIYAGEQLYTTYSQCEDCEGRSTNYGTPEIFRDYGFVEQFPQRWVFQKQDFGFDVDENEDLELVVEWMEAYPYPDEENLDFLRDELDRLKDVEDQIKEGVVGVPEREMALLGEYLDSVIVAIDAALADHDNENEDIQEEEL